MNALTRQFVVASTVAILSGCGTVSRYTLDTEFDSTPIKTSTKLTDALQCLGGQLQSNLNHPGAFVFMVRSITDGTVKQSDYSDGPLADAGRLQLISILSAHTKPSYGVVLDEFPFMLRSVVNEQIGLNRFGVPSQENMSAFVSQLTQYTNLNRQANGMPLVTEVMPLTIEGAFTRYDSSRTRSKGYGQNAGYRGDTNDEQSASVDFGNSGSERSITLVVNVIDPKNNVVVGTEGFDLKFYSNSKTARFRVAIDQYYYGFSNTDVKVETVHAAQQTLLEASAIWILDNAYGRMVDLSPCFDSEARLALGTDSRYQQTVAKANGDTTPAVLIPETPQEGAFNLQPPASSLSDAVLPAATETPAITPAEAVALQTENTIRSGLKVPPDLDSVGSAVGAATETVALQTENTIRSGLKVPPDLDSVGSAVGAATEATATQTYPLPTLTDNVLPDSSAATVATEATVATGATVATVAKIQPPATPTDNAKPSSSADWYVSAGIFCVKTNASKLSMRLKNNGFEGVYLRQKAIDQCLATVVWLGPFAGKIAAKKVNTKLVALTGQPGYVTNSESR